MGNMANGTNDAPRETNKTNDTPRETNVQKEMSSQIKENSKQLSKGLATAYKLPGVQKFLQEHCKDNDCKDVLNDDDTFTVASTEEGLVENHMQRTLDQLDVWTLSVNMSIDTVISDIRKELGAFEPGDTVAIETNPKHDIVQISGLKTEVKKPVEQMSAYLSKNGIEKKIYHTDCLTLRFIQEFRVDQGQNPSDDELQPTADVSVEPNLAEQIDPFTVEIPDTITSTDAWISHQSNEEFNILVDNLEESFQCPLELVEQPIYEPKGDDELQPTADVSVEPNLAEQIDPFSVEIPDTITSTDAWISHQSNEEFNILVDNLEESFQCPLELVEQPIYEPKGDDELQPTADVSVEPNLAEQIDPFTVEIPDTITSTDAWISHQSNEEFNILVDNLEESFQCPLELVEQPIYEPKGVELISPIALFIDVKLGDITKEEADILVNVTNKELKLAVKDVAQDFLEAGGEELQEELSKYWREDLKYGDIIYVPAVGRLKENCKFIANVILPAWADVNSCEVIAESVRGCLTFAKQNGLSSVAFPTIGCGRLNYPVDEVATCLLKTAGEFIQNDSDSLEVKVVVLEQSLFDTFLSASKGIGRIKTQSDGGATKEDFGEDMQVGASASANTESTFQRRSKYSLKGVTLRNNVDRTKGNILKVLEDEFYAEVIDLKRYPKDKVLKFIGTSSNFLKSLGVQADTDLINWKLQLSGKRERVTLALEEVSKKITNTNTDEYPLPEYWPQSEETFVCLPLDQQSPLYNTIKKLVHGTWQAKYTGYGRDAQGIKRSAQIQVKTVEVNINRELYALYLNRRETLMRSYKSSKYNKVDVKPVLTEEYLSEVLANNLDPNLNEFYLLHGTKQETVKPICTQGFDFRVGNDGGMLGKGIYFGESSSKADQYADARGRRSNGKDLKMILTRVCMGCIFLCSDDNPTQFSRPPCTTCFQDICTHNHDFYDSVVYANPNKNFREFIIYELHQSYPEFIITYDRVAGN